VHQDFEGTEGPLDGAEMGHDRSQLPLQRLLLDLQTGQVLPENLSGDLNGVRRARCRDHVFLSSSTLFAAYAGAHSAQR
jgi:hypothetical protein